MTIANRISRALALVSNHVVSPATGGHVSYSQALGLYVGRVRLVTERQLGALEDTAYKRGRRRPLSTDTVLMNGAAR